MKNTTKKGFTLVELLIVITIIGILAAALLPSILGAPAKSRDAAREAGMSQVVTAIETYMSSVSGATYPAPVVPGVCSQTLTQLNAYFPSGVAPKDPSGDIPGNPVCNGYWYIRLDGSPSNYALVTSMEDTKKNNVNYANLATVAKSSGTDLTALDYVLNTLPATATCRAANNCNAYVKAF